MAGERASFWMVPSMETRRRVTVSDGKPGCYPKICSRGSLTFSINEEVVARVAV